MVNTVGKRLLYLFAYKFRNLFFFLTLVFGYFAFAEDMMYMIYAVLCLALGIAAQITRNKVVKKIKEEPKAKEKPVEKK